MATNHEVGSSTLSGCKNFDTVSGGSLVLVSQKFKPWQWASLLTLFDLVWCLQAFGQQPSHATSTVSVASLVLWIYLHLPAALAASLLLKPWGLFEQAATTPLPSWALLSFAGLGLIETFGLTYAAVSWFKGRPRP